MTGTVSAPFQHLIKVIGKIVCIEIPDSTIVSVLPARSTEEPRTIYPSNVPRSRMPGRNGGRGQGDARAGRGGRGDHGKSGRGSGYSSKPKTTKVGLCKELEGHIFDYGGHGAADLMRVTQDKIQQ